MNLKKVIVVLIWIAIVAVLFLTKEQPYLDYDVTAPARMNFFQLTIGGLIAALAALVFFGFILITVKVMME
jgi:hypothetical protein